LGALAHFERV